MVEVISLNTGHVSQMAKIASQAHSHPMSEKLLESCFGGLYHIFGAVENGELLGFAIVHIVFEDATLIDICMQPKSQGKGAGKRLLHHVISFSKAKAVEAMLLEVRRSGTRAITLYENYGFIRTGERKAYYPSGNGKEDAILMSLNLTD